jgi:hypothetical protein
LSVNREIAKGRKREMGVDHDNNILHSPFPVVHFSFVCGILHSSTFVADFPFASDIFQWTKDHGEEPERGGMRNEGKE